MPTSYSPDPVSPGLYAFSDQNLVQIISKTQTALEEMSRVNTLVTSQTDTLVGVNRSDSGRLLSQHLNTWTTDFHICVNNLHDLNQKAAGLRQVNLGAAATSTSQAR
jgi:hypothetical protein